MYSSPYVFRIKITFNKANGEKITTEGKIGDSLLDVIINNNLDFDGYGIPIKYQIKCLFINVYFKKIVFIFRCM